MTTNTTDNLTTPTFEESKDPTIIATASKYLNAPKNADFNGDGNPDVVSTIPFMDNGKSNVLIALGDGKGNFATPTSVFTGVGYDGDYGHEISIVDLNSDSKPDLVINNNQKIYVLLNDGKGSFTEQSISPDQQISTNIGDFNGDDKTDIFTVNDYGRSVSVFMGDGHGSFATPITTDLSMDFYSVNVSDFNLDGKADLVTDGKDIKVLLGDGLGKFLTAVPVEKNVSGENHVNVGDFNTDGKPDLILKTSTYNSETKKIDDTIKAFLNTTSTSATLPTNTPPTGNVTITGNTEQNETLTASNTLVDADGLGKITYQWLSDDVAIKDSTQITYALTQADVGKKISVTASYVDGLGNAESVTSDGLGIVNVNDLPTGSVVITGDAQQGKTLTASNTLADLDGLGTISYQWLSGDAIISGANQTSYTLTAADVNKAISVKASYTDLQNTTESVTSTKTPLVTSNASPKPTNGNDKLIGTAKNDTLNGGLGFDELTGGTGADKFVYKSIKDAPLSHSKIEVITDFSHSEKDKIDLSGIDADTSKAKDQAFSKPEMGAEFSGVFTKAGQLFFDTTNHVLYGNVNADETADFAIQLNGVTSLVAGDFVL